MSLNLYNSQTKQLTPLAGNARNSVVGATSEANGVAGLVPQPLITDRNKFLKGDGTWAEVPAGGTTIVQMPSVTVDEYTYNGSAQGPTVSGLDSLHCIVTNATKIDAGNYTLTIALSDPTTMVWSDLTVADKTYNYSIAKAAGTVTVSKSEVILDSEHLTDTFTVSNVTGNVTLTSSDTTVATVSPASLTNEGGTVTVTSVNSKTGSPTITVSVAATSNYEATSTTVSITASFIPILEEATWAQIKTIGDAGTGDTYWDVGDTKTIILNGTVGTLALSNQSVKVFIVAFNHGGTNGVYFQGFKSTDETPVDIALCDANYGSNSSDGSKWFNLNHWGSSSSPYNTNYGGWKGCDARYDILGSTNTQPSNYGSTPQTSRVGYDASSGTATSPVSNTLMAALPSDLRSVLAPMTLYTDNTGNSSNVAANVTTSVDYLALPSEWEIFGARTYANEYEQNSQSQLTYYSSGNSKIKYNHSNTGTAVLWWLRSPIDDNAGIFCFVSTSGTAGGNNSRASRGLAPVFRVA